MILPLLALLAAPSLAGDTVHEVSVTGGVQYVRRTDTLISPLPHRGAAPGLALGWSPRAERAATDVVVSLNPGSTRSVPKWSFQRDGQEVTADASPVTLVDLRVAHGRRVDLGDAALHLGATFADHFENNTFVNGFLGMEFYLGALELGPWADLRAPLGERMGVEAAAWAPLAAWMARNPYAVHSGEHIWNTRDNKPLNIIFRYLGDGSPQTWNHYQAVHLRSAWVFELSQRFLVVASARVDGFAFSVPKPTAQWQLGAEAGLRGRF